MTWRTRSGQPVEWATIVKNKPSTLQRLSLQLNETWPDTVYTNYT